MSEHSPSKELAEALEQIRHWHKSAKPDPTENPAWFHAENDIGFLLDYIDQLRAPSPPTASDDTARLDYLDQLNQQLNNQSGSTYGWKLEINHNRVALTDMHIPRLSVREAIDALRPVTKSVQPPATQGRQRLGEIPAATSTVGESREAGEAAGGCTAPETSVAQDMEKIAWCQKVHEDLALYIDDSSGQMIHVRAKRALGIMFDEMQKLEKALYPLDAPVAWRRLLDNPDTLKPQWHYTHQQPTISPEKWQPVYVRSLTTKEE